MSESLFIPCAKKADLAKIFGKISRVQQAWLDFNDHNVRCATRYFQIPVLKH